MTEGKKETSFEVIRRVFLGATSIFIGIIYIVFIIPVCVLIIDFLLEVCFIVIVDIVSKLQTSSFDSIINSVSHYSFELIYSSLIFILSSSKIAVIIILISYVLYIIGDANIKITNILKRDTQFTRTLKRYKVVFQFIIFMIIFTIYNSYGPIILEMIL